MKKTTYALLFTIVSGALVTSYSLLPENKPTDREKLSAFLKEHPFSKRPRLQKGEKFEGGKPAAPDRAWEQDYLRTLDPALGRPTPEALIPVMEAMQMQANMGLAPGASQAPWEERGPNNVGGRTRGLVWDPNDGTGKKVWAGGVNGGLWYNNDITSANSSWVGVDDFWNNIAITAIAFDPANPQIMYVGTGEGFTANGASGARGAGIWKSTNGGTTWSHLSSTDNFYWVLDIVVRDEGGTGVVYAAVDGRYYAGDWHGLSEAGIQRSTNGGSSWSNVSPNVPSESLKLIAADLEIGADNRVWAGSKANPYNGNDRGGGRVFYSDNGTSWTISNSTSVSNGDGRVAIACAPSDADVVYAVVESDGQVEALVRTTNKGSSWSACAEPEDVDQGIPDTDFSRGQAWYDLAIAVDPNNSNVVIAGAIDLFRSANGGTSWSHISKWSDNNDLWNLNCSYVHADQHTIVFKPGSSSTVVFGNDGGVYYTSSVTTAANNDVIQARNKDYNITQYYACAIHPGAGSNVFLAGAQDNGTQRYNSAGVNSTSEITGGDGAYCFIDQTDPDVAVSSYIYNNFYLFSNSGLNFVGDIMSDDATGKFINPADYDDNNHILYSTKDATSIWRVRNIHTSPATPESLTISGMNDEVSHLRASPYSNTLFIGNDVGEIYKVSNANGSHSSTDITGGSMPAGTVSCIEIGASDDELLVTFFNYGVVSVWYTSNGGANWVSKEGNLPNMPVRWALFNPNNRNEVILATDLGVWSTDNLNAGSPSWTSSSAGLANTRVDMLQIRASDQMVIAATHGRGLFSSDAFAAQAPVADFAASTQNVCLPQTVSFYDSSVHDPTSWSWDFVPNTVEYKNGTSFNSQNPVVRFTAPGTYAVTLIAMNALGADDETKTAYITVSANLVPSVVLQASAASACAGTNVNFTAQATNQGSTPVYQWRINSLPVGTNSPSFSSSTLLDGDSVTCEVTSSDPCAFAIPYKSLPVVMEIWDLPVVELDLGIKEICEAGDPFTLTGGTPLGGTYSGTGVNGPDFDLPGVVTGVYAITYQYIDGNGCSNTDVDNITVNPVPAKPTISQNGNELTCSVTGTGYEWTLNGNVINAADSKTLTMTASGSYTVKVTNGNGCSSTSDPTDAWMTGVGEIKGLTGLRVFPNPSKGPVTVSYELNDSRSVTYAVFDAQGKQVYVKTAYAEGKVNEVLELNLAAGNYVLRISDGTSELSRKIVIGN